MLMKFQDSYNILQNIRIIILPRHYIFFFPFFIHSLIFLSRTILRLDINIRRMTVRTLFERNFRREEGLEMTRHVKPLTVSQSNCVDLCGGRFEATDNAACRNVKTPK